MLSQKNRMSEHFFRFKQFTIFHDQCAMKVGTDGVLLGAWADCRNTQQILDIGAGSGLVTLMLAQRSSASVLGIELDKNACKQARNNAEQSPFSNRIEIEEGDFIHWSPPHSYDLIVSNPPYFIHSLQSTQKERSLARHRNELSIENLLKKSYSVLSTAGKISLILPYEQLEYTDKIAANLGLSKIRETRVKPLQSTPPKRVLLEYSLQRSCLESTEFFIEVSRHKYSQEYINLTKSFYINM